MGNLIVAALTVFAGRAFSSVLLGAGLGLATSGIILTAANGFLSSGLAQMGTISGDVLGLAALSGIDKGISIVIGAVVFRATLSSMSIKLAKK